jgi:hypothetical protein
MKGTFENDYVIIGQAHPKMHIHPYNRVMIYGTAGGEWLHFVDGHTQDLKWQAGEVKWSPVEKPHYSEIPPGFDEGQQRGPAGLDIGIKKPGVSGTVARTALDPLRADPQSFKLEYENSQVRVLRLKMGPRQSVPMHECGLSIVWYYTDQNVRETSPDGKAEVKQHKAGEWVWENGPRRLKIDNLNDRPFEAIVVEVKN